MHCGQIMVYALFAKLLICIKSIFQNKQAEKLKSREKTKEEGLRILL